MVRFIKLRNGKRFFNRLNIREKMRRFIATPRKFYKKHNKLLKKMAKVGLAIGAAGLAVKGLQSGMSMRNRMAQETLMLGEKSIVPLEEDVAKYDELQKLKNAGNIESLEEDLRKYDEIQMDKKLDPKDYQGMLDDMEKLNKTEKSIEKKIKKFESKAQRNRPIINEITIPDTDYRIKEAKINKEKIYKSKTKKRNKPIIREIIEP